MPLWLCPVNLHGLVITRDAAKLSVCQRTYLLDCLALVVRAADIPGICLGLADMLGLEYGEETTSEKYHVQVRDLHHLRVNGPHGII